MTLRSLGRTNSASSYSWTTRPGTCAKRHLAVELLEGRALLAVLFEHGPGDAVRALVPSETDYDDLGFDWLGAAEPFDDSSWLTVSSDPNGIGYDRGDGAYEPAIGLDVESALYGNATMLFVRTEFDVTDAALVDILTLHVRYDDGFIAWLNGQEIARANVTGSYPAWDTAADSQYESPLTPVEFDVSAFTSALRSGGNILAIRLFNDSPTGDDALLQFTLTGENRTGPPIAHDDAGETLEGRAVNIDVLANDVEGADPIDPASVVLNTLPSHGTAVVSPDGTITYTPNGVYNGSDTFTYTVRDDTASNQPSTQTLVASNAAVRALVPLNDSLGTTWRGLPTNEPFSDASWTSGTFGVGYDANPSGVDFNPLIGTNVQTAMRNVNTTIYLRTSFELEDPADVSALRLRMRYDDGFAAFLNGVRVASSWAADSLNYASAITGPGFGNGDTNAIVFETFDISQFASSLRAGTNILAIHGLNLEPASSDMLIQPELVATILPQGRVSNVATVTVNVTGVDYPPIARHDTYAMIEGETLNVENTPSGGPTVTREWIAPNATWHYHDKGTTPPNDAEGDSWREHDFDDSAWPSGPGEIGYGDGDEATSVDCGPSRPVCNSDNYMTTWFRSHFTLAPGEAGRTVQLTMNVLRDDGAAVYINGVEVWRDNLPGIVGDNTLTPTTAASSPIFENGELIYQPPLILDSSTFNLSGLLHDGDNVVAVEVHQINNTSSDLSLKMHLSATVLSSVNPLANDVEPDEQPLGAELASEPQHGTLEFRPDGTFTYVPAAGFVGVDSFQYRASDGDLLSGPATVRIVVAPPGKLREDLNADGVVDRGDVAFLLFSHGKSNFATSTEGDLDRNGRIDVRDAVLTRNAFTALPPPSPQAASDAAAGLIARASERRIAPQADGELLRAVRRTSKAIATTRALSIAAADQAFAANASTTLDPIAGRSRWSRRLSSGNLAAE
jgi:hypothetical protein